MENLISQLKKKNPHLKAREIEGVLYLIKTIPDLTNGELIRQTGLPKETLRFLKVSIADLLETPKGDRLVLNPSGEKLLGSLELSPYKWSLLEYTDDSLEKQLLELREKYDLAPKREYDQFFATVRTSIAKSKVLFERGVVKDKRIALLGDDDLLSIVLGLSTDSFKEIIVFDIDTDILNAIDTMVEELGIKNIRTEVYDARDDVNANKLGKFDVVITDPPYTRSGISLFLRRSLEFLGKVGNFDGKYVFLYFGNSFKSPEKVLKVQEVINSYNLVVEDKLEKFSRYHGAESIGSSSSLYVLKATPITDIPLDMPETKIYTFEDQKEEKFPFVDHYTFKLLDVPMHILNSKTKIIRLVKSFCDKHKLSVVDTKVTIFKKGGLTLTFVLGQSNLCLHTWPEHKALHVDLITCSPIYNKPFLVETLAFLFGTQKIESRKIE